MASITIGFSIPKEDEARLQHLVQRFGQGNRSALLRVAMKHMEVLDRAERLDELSRFGAERLEARGILPDEIPALVKQVPDDGDLLTMSPWRGTPIIRISEFASRVDAMRRARRRQF